MSNKSHKIAGPIINRAMGQAGYDIFQIARDVRAALTEAKTHPCVIDEWANEPHRRVMMRLASNRSTHAAQIRRRDEKRHAAAKARRRVEGVHRKIMGGAKKIVTRIFRGGARNQ